MDFKGDILAIEREIDWLFENADPVVGDPVRAFVARGGKRWRPLMMLLFCRAGGGGDAALPFTPIVELVHNGTLVADDIEDGSLLRRGEPALHMTHGIDVALNNGNWLYFLPLKTLEKGACVNAIDPKTALRLYRAYGETLRRVHLGQAYDIAWHNSGFDAPLPTEEEYMKMCRLKTGALSGCAARMGVICAGGDEKQERSALRIAEDAGAAFQILDDVTNLRAGNPGKERGDDIREGKKSLPVILFAAQSGENRSALQNGFRRLNGSDICSAEETETIQRLTEEIAESGVLDRAHDQAQTLIRRSIEELDILFPEESGAKAGIKNMLNRFADPSRLC